MSFFNQSAADASKALCELARPVSRIARNARFVEMITQKGATKYETAWIRTETLIPLLMGEHLVDTMEIIRILSGRSAEEMENRTVAELVQDIETYIDKDFFDFFLLCAAMAMRL